MRKPADRSSETITWGALCTKVRFGDGLYQACRDKLPDFTGFEGGMYDEDEEETDEDFDKMLRKSALPVPEFPAERRSKKKASKKPAEASSFGDAIEQLMHGSLGRNLLYGSAAAGLVYFFWMRNREPSKPIVTTETPTAAAGATQKAA